MTERSPLIVPHADRDVAEFITVFPESSMRKIVGAFAALVLVASPALASGNLASVPEPSSATLIAGGMAALVMMAWKRKK